LISESGIQTKQDVELAFEAGADAVLVGTALWNAENMVATYHDFSRI
jgi:indole-3-glycerol phosphate synthase